MVKASLIMPTLGRTKEILLFMESLKLQKFRDFELIIIDQNSDNRLEDIIPMFIKDLNLVYFKSDKKGLSYNRNIGLSMAKGQILAFPDDDCIYNDPETLSKVVQFFDNSKYDFLSFNTLDFDTKIPVVKLSNRSMDIRWGNVFNTSISFTIFVKDLTNSLINFDDKLGVGAAFGSAEESDMIYNLLDQGCCGYYICDSFIHHPSKVEKLNSDKGLNYGLGMGALFKKNIVYRRKIKDLPRYILMLSKPIVRMILLKNFSFYWNTLKGRVVGFINYKK